MVSQSTSTETSGYGGPWWRPAVLISLALTVLVLPWVAPAIPRMLAGAVPDFGAPETVAETNQHRPEPELWIPPQRVAPTVTPARVPSATLHASAGVPRRLAADRLGVQSGVVPISGESGVLLPPSDAQLLGWWREGAVPGAASGTAVLTGHTVSTGGGAFDHLERLARGDEVAVRTAKGAIRYTVTSSRNFGTAALAKRSGEIFRLDGPGRLVLITCSGYDGRVYRSNTVVTAVPVA